ncbi:GNAT family N-acetyltransferase [Brachybacterium sp. AOP43-C2-M15]|uniref:GNAT family N-acetyltransferase n=1 Tax=Brachybacterium sp. AOP43-C2-M15 TaxID=3457661 RepID=UPI004033E8C0
MTRRDRRPSAPSPRPLTGARLGEALIAGWRPLQRLDADGFAVLRSRGITRRAHSILALEAPQDEHALRAAVERVDSLVALAGEQPVHRVVEGVSPDGLDPLLAARGDRAVGGSEILELPLTGGLPRPHPSAVIATGALDPEWFEAAWHLAPREGDRARETMRDILAGTPSIQVRLPAGDEPDAAVGRAALVESGRETLVILTMIAVAPEHRRRGLGRALSGTLLALADVQGARRALLEVESDSTPARTLYRSLGFRRIGGYHYRVGTSPVDPA